MAKKEKLEELFYCERCGGSLPRGTRPLKVETSDGKVLSLCQECAWAVRAEEDVPALSLDENIEVDEKALQSIRRPQVESPAPAPTAEEKVEVEEEVEETEEVPTGVGAPMGGFALRRCKTFVSQVTPQALEFLDTHIAEFIRSRKIKVKYATTCYGMAGIGTQGTRVDAYFVTIWW